MARNFKFSEGEFYHIYNRGTEKRTIFLEDFDYRRFQLLLYLYNQNRGLKMREIFSSGKNFSELFLNKREEELVEIGAYCLMPNHYHLLIREKKEGGISEFMRKLSDAYTGSFNKKYDRTGVLFEGRFKARHVKDENEAYLQYLFSYIHLNPVKILDSNWKELGVKDLKKTKKYLDEYAYSSYPDITGIKRNENRILNLKNFPQFFEESNEFNDFIEYWLEYEN